jgi:DNA polymerase (family 10)
MSTLTREDAAIFIAELKKINKNSVNGTIQIAGSYRRESPILKDIDILWVSKKKQWSNTLVPINLLKLPGDVVESNNGIVHKLTTVKFKNKLIKCDMYVVNKFELPFALLHSTGSKGSNLGLRIIAINKGWLLNQYGLWIRDKPTERVPTSEKIKDEKGVFQILGKKYKEPAERI